MPKITIKEVRMAFPAVFEPKPVGASGDESMRYSAAFVIPPGSPAEDAIKAAIQAAATEKWKGKAKDILANLIAKGRMCYQDSPLTNGDGEVYDGFEGMCALNATSKVRPTVVDRDRAPLSERDGRPYGGCYVNAIVEIWAQDNAFGRRVNAQLKGVQFAKDGDAFGAGGAANADEFEDLEPLDDADDFLD